VRWGASIGIRGVQACSGAFEDKAGVYAAGATLILMIVIAFPKWNSRKAGKGKQNKTVSRGGAEGVERA
jgi:hypothetical protein